MAWQTPKTNWTPSDALTSADMNRMEENTKELKNAKVGFSDLSTPGKTIIDGSNIKTKTIKADSIDVTDLAVGKIIDIENPNLELTLLKKWGHFDVDREVVGMEIKNTANDNVLFAIYSNNSSYPYNAVYMDFAPNGRESLNTSYMYVPRNFKLTSVDPDDPTAVSSSINFSVGGIHQFANFISFTTDEDIPNNFQINGNNIWHAGNFRKETGNYTPTVNYGTWYGNGSYSIIGDLCYFRVYLVYATNSGTSDGVTVTLPETSSADTNHYSNVNARVTNVNTASYRDNHWGYIAPNSGTVLLHSGDNVLGHNYTVTNSKIYLSGVYKI